MRIFGKQIGFGNPFVRAAAPNLPQPPDNPRDPLVEPLPPFGTNPPKRPLVGASTDLAERLISSDPRDLWYLALPNKLTPNQVVMILRSALGGDIWQQWQLMSLMLDTWPMLRKCAHEIRQAVAGVDYTVRPYAEEGKEPTASAKEKADLVSRAMRNMRPNPFSDEVGFHDMVYDITDAMLNGITLIELLWWDKQAELLPRAAAWVHPRHFTFGTDGKMAVFDVLYNRLKWDLANKNSPGPDPNKFLCCQFKSRSGSSLGAGLMRPLAWYWSAVVFNKEWMLGFAQKYGNPFLDAAYQPGMSNEEIESLKSFVKGAGSQGWCVHPDKATIQVHPAQSLGADNPQVNIMKQADDACQILLLGQTATTSGTPGKLGGEDVHESVKRENVQAVARFVSRLLTEQFAAAIIRNNYGNDDELPTIEADMTGEGDPQAEASRDSVFINAGIPLDAAEFYHRHNLKMPDKGDKVIVGGKLGVLGDTNEEIEAVPKPPPMLGGPGGEVDEEGNPIPGAEGAEEDGEEGEGDEEEESDEKDAKEEPKKKADKGKKEEDDEEEEDEDVDASGAIELERAIKAASDNELKELRECIIQANQAPEVNGEWEAVQVKIKTLQKRIKL